MNRELLRRIKVAGEYQRKAVLALFPESVGEHLDVIEKEMKMMVKDAAADFLKSCKKEDACEACQDGGKAAKVKKVEIVSADEEGR